METLSKTSHDQLHIKDHSRFPYSPPQNNAPSLLLLQNFYSLALLVIVVYFMGTLLLSTLQKWSPSNVVHIFLASCLIIFVLIKLRFAKYSYPVYLVDFACLKPPSFCRVPFSTFLENASMFQSYESESLTFMDKILSSSGQSEETYLPPALHYIPPITHHQESIKEVHMVLFPIMDDLFTKTKLSPSNIDILIVNCSGFCSTPSLSSIVIKKYAMKCDIKSFNLSGMGCSASAIGIDLAKNLLRVHKDSYAIVLSIEILSPGWYSGQDRSKLAINCLFRMGSTAILLTNKKQAKKNSKYQLVRTLRTQRAFEDKAYLSAIREEDSKGNLGVTLKRDLLQVAGETLRSNVAVLGSSLLPFKEKFRHGVSVVRKRFFDKSCEIYVPDFKTVIQHFCLPASGLSVIKEIAKGLKLEKRDMEPALMTLHRFGNQSSSSLWYELAYLEAKNRVEKGDMVWLLGMGTGPKCNSVVLKCIRPDAVKESKISPWADCIHRYPIL
ncbi:3-ketoacyl-CoA synthase 5-like [Humulus lupulus]|uniref:3-ketoacyl-CoA synthase 5-like n=1 Tax=Humulus lupulus TaxID=3486 RepID=UPI002B4137C4|nr:3-ketoacyl-CoA synthase 5-like [Humulus lupulus]